MSIDQEILGLPEGKDFTVKELSLRLNCSVTSLYKPLNKLVREGLVHKRDKEIQGRHIAFYSIPSKEVIGGCRWQSHKEILLAGRTYQKKVLEYDFWPSLKEEMLTLAEREENRHIGIVGLVGTGKSSTAIFLARVLDPFFGVKDIIFTKERLLELVADQPRNKSFVFDDVGVMLSSRTWQEKERGLIFSWLQICRMHRVNTVSTSPSLPMIDVNYQRLLHYVLQVELKCKGHIHIIVFNPIQQADQKVGFKPIGTLTFVLPGEPYSSIFQEYLAIKQKKLSLSARASLEKLQIAKVGVQRYIQGREVTRVTDDVVRSALHTVGLDGSLPKQEKDNLRTVMFDSLQEKKQREKKVKAEQKRIGTENFRKARLLSSYKSKYQAFIDKGHSKEYSKRLARRLTCAPLGNLKNLQGVVGSLMKKVKPPSVDKPSSVEKLILERLDDVFLVRDLMATRDILGSFRGFSQEFYTKLFKFIFENSEKAIKFIQKANKMRSDWRYLYYGKFSASSWWDKVNFSLSEFESEERRSLAFKDRLTTVAVGIYSLIKKDPKLLSEVLSLPKKKFWGDV